MFRHGATRKAAAGLRQRRLYALLPRGLGGQSAIEETVTCRQLRKHWSDARSFRTTYAGQQNGPSHGTMARAANQRWFSFGQRRWEARPEAVTRLRSRSIVPKRGGEVRPGRYATCPGRPPATWRHWGRECATGADSSPPDVKRSYLKNRPAVQGGARRKHLPGVGRA